MVSNFKAATHYQLMRLKKTRYGSRVNTVRHNAVIDTTAHLLEKVKYGVQSKPNLLPVGNKTLPTGTNLTDGARLDIVARGFWSPLDKAFFDVRDYTQEPCLMKTKLR